MSKKPKMEKGERLVALKVDVKIRPAAENPMFSAEQTACILFLHYSRAVPCAACGRKARIHWTALRFFKAPLLSGAMTHVDLGRTQQLLIGKDMFDFSKRRRLPKVINRKTMNKEQEFPPLTPVCEDHGLSFALQYPPEAVRSAP